MNVSIAYPQKIQWRLDLLDQDNPLFPYKKDTGNRIRKARERIEKSNQYYILIEPVDRKYIDAFEPVYQEFIQRIGGTLFDIRKKIIEQPPHNFPYYSISLYETNRLIGGMIFSKRADCLSVAYRVFPQKLSLSLPKSVSYVCEMILNEYALTENKRLIIHGTDRNAFGKYSTIGLPEYKLSIGAIPIIPPESELQVKMKSFSWSKKKPALLFLWPDTGSVIKQARLLGSNQQLHEIRQKYPHVNTYLPVSNSML